MKYASVCSGVEAASLAWMPLGWEAVWFSEIEPFPCAVLKERFPNVPNLGDMTKIEGEKYRGTVDLLVGGTPCQGFSVAGKQGGLDDPRSALCLAYCRLLETMRPRWFVWENVPGVFSTNGGEDFREFLRKIDEIGYSCAWRVLDAQYVRVDGFPRAVPQRRRRVFLVGYLGDWRYPASVLFEPGCLPGDTPPRRVKGEGVARSLTASTGGSSGKEQQHTFISGDGRPLNAIEVMATGQANAETATDHCVNLTCNHEAPIVCAHETGPGYWQDGDIAGTLRAEGENRPSRPSNIVSQYGDVAGALTARHDSSPCADRGMNVVYENHAQDSRVKPCGECCPQINAKAGTSGGNLPLVHECYPINGMVIGNGVRVNDQHPTGIGTDGDPIPTITKAHHHAVAMRHVVRRLLPIETERLMGFPDNWTRIPWRGKPEEECPDAPRYKACGNSMCVNVMRWIGMRIEHVERRIGKRQDRIK